MKIGGKNQVDISSLIVHDISMPIKKEMMVYKNKEEKKSRIEQTRTIKEGARESRISIDSHTGTHMDAPSHMLADGNTIDKYKKFIHDAVVIDLTEVNSAITKEHLQKHKIRKSDFVLLKTKNSFTEEFYPDFIYLDKSGAQYLAGAGVIGIGIDALSIERNDPEHNTHKILLEKGIMILEGLRLKNIKEGNYTLIAAPLNIEGCDGSPVRALLIEK